MVDFLNDDNTFEGKTTFEGEAIVNGTLTIGPGGGRYGRPGSYGADTWRMHQRVQVTNIASRDALVAWRNANAPISGSMPLLVWRANGSSTGVNEMTVDGVNWYAESPLAGDIQMTLAEEAPYGWALMKGQLLTNAQTNYPALWAAASPALRSGSSLRIPDMRGRVPMGMGKGSGLTLRNLGDLLGNELETLTVANMPAHGHTGTTQGADRSLNHDHRLNLGHDTGSAASGSGQTFEIHDPVGGDGHLTGTVARTSDPTTGGALSHLHPFVTNQTGGGEPHPNVQPSTVVNFQVKL